MFATASTSTAGIGCYLANVINNPVWKLDGKGYEFTNNYDALNRPTTTEVNGGISPNPAITSQIVSRIEYGEAETNPELLNLRGQAVRIFDGAGVTKITAFDFKGSPLTKTQQLVEDAPTLPDWTTPASLNLLAEVYTSSIQYDALGRPLSTSSAADTSMTASVTKHTYNEAGLLETVSTFLQGSVVETAVVTNINYNSKGQRTDIYYGNTTKTRYYYDSKTFQLKRLLTTRNTGSVVLQDSK